ncbi:uncharacterized protein LOC122038633 [Zingiber officinale]|uniref:uncharacterized protein LOC122038633 n=1 Tax=Zingiber officinale TaxID=94328 RepID=UPI001C4D2A25|nr:uncharacterized protein LOC122038633 [Zingiber officinale]
MAAFILSLGSMYTKAGHKNESKNIADSRIYKSWTYESWTWISSGSTEVVINPLVKMIKKTYSRSKLLLVDCLLACKFTICFSRCNVLFNSDFLNARCKRGRFMASLMCLKG